MEQYLTSILIALIGIIPALLAFRSATRAKKSVELAGSDVTVQNWNRLIKNLYGEIERLTDQNDQERRRAQKRELELTTANEALRQEIGEMQAQADSDRRQFAAEKRQLLERIDQLSDELHALKEQVKATMPDVDLP